MSQKLVLALCVVAGFVAYSSAQSMNPMDCANNMQDEVNKYAMGVSNSITQFTNALGNSGGQLADLEPFRKDINRIGELLMSLTNMSNGFDGARVVQIQLEIMQIQARLARNAMRFSLLQGVYGDYMKMVTDMMNLNMGFMANVANQCVPNTKAFTVERRH